jgi:hypothetical protein
VKDRVFIARSAGPIDADKAAEKLETVAVGRALAFMGIGVLESVASADEIQNYEQRKSIPPRPVDRVVTKDSGDLPSCPKCGGNFKLVPAGVSKKSGKKYDAFYSCTTQGCKSTVSLERADDLMDTKVKQAEAIFSDNVPPPPMPPDYDTSLPF